jgi:hypothetical protein
MEMLEYINDPEKDIASFIIKSASVTGNGKCLTWKTSNKYLDRL